MEKTICNMFIPVNKATHSLAMLMESDIPVRDVPLSEKNVKLDFTVRLKALFTYLTYY